jgi:hypothetical protein
VAKNSKLMAKLEAIKPSDLSDSEQGRVNLEWLDRAMAADIASAAGTPAPRPPVFTKSLGQRAYEEAACATDPKWMELSRETKREWEIAALPKPCTSIDKPDSGRAGLSNATSEDKHA